jgi:hypothetical protein
MLTTTIPGTEPAPVHATTLISLFSNARLKFKHAFEAATGREQGDLMDFFGVCATFATRRIFDHDGNIKLPTSHYSAGTSFTTRSVAASGPQLCA